LYTLCLIIIMLAVLYYFSERGACEMLGER